MVNIRLNLHLRPSSTLIAELYWKLLPIKQFSKGRYQPSRKGIVSSERVTLEVEIDDVERKLQDEFAVTRHAALLFPSIGDVRPVCRGRQNLKPALRVCVSVSTASAAGSFSNTDIDEVLREHPCAPRITF